MNRISFLIIFLFFVFPAYSQDIKVIDSESRTPIENVYIYNQFHSVLTNSNGIANISEFLNSVHIILQHPAYKDLRITIQEIKKQSYTLLLQSNIFPIQEVVVSANKWEQKPDEIPFKIIRIDNSTIKNTNSQTSADLLQSTNQVYIQKSQLGGGSPMIRGFSANRVLLVLDGVRLNNAIYRSGNLQNVINIDPNSLESMEVILGPGSTIYGSDAIGGVMDFHTLKPKFSSSITPLIIAKFKSRYSSVNHEILQHGNYNYGKSKFSLAGSISYNNFSDLKMGSHGPAEYLRNEYIKQINDQDVIIKNPKPQLQKQSGYDQLNVLQKIRLQLNPKLELNYNFQYSKTSDIPRYDRLIQYSDDKLKYAQWYYGPQKLQFHQLSLKNTKSKLLFDNYKINAAYQNYQESRHSRKLNSEILNNRMENLDIFSINFDAVKTINPLISLFYGAEWTNNSIESRGYAKNIYSKIEEAISSRYPNGSTYSSFALYSNLKWEIKHNWIFNSGLRYSYSRINAKLNKTFYPFPFDNLNLSNGAITGAIGITHLLSNKWLFKFNTTTGFRAPNIDDVGKVFDSEPGKVVVPNKNLRPEYVTNIEGNVSKTINKLLFLDINVFYSYLNRAMKRDDFTFNGKNKILYDGELSEVQATVNTDNAKIWGVSIHSILKISDKLNGSSFLNYTKGKYKNGSPVRHVPPIFGNIALKFDSQKFTSRLTMLFNGRINYKNLADTERSKAYLYAKNSNGLPYSPSWIILNTQSSYQITKHLLLQLALKNILDKRYRPYSSGISAPGRNISITLDYQLSH